jgi:hypothetical protein
MKPIAAILLITEIAKGLRHKDYEHVAKLTKLYRQLFLGEGIDELIVQKSLREDRATLELRKKFAIIHTPAWADSMINDFHEVHRIRAVAKGFKYDDATREKASGLQYAIDNFYGHNNIDFWIKERIHNLTFIDPNAFVAIETLPFDNRIKKAKPYPFISKSDDCLYYNYVNDVLQSLGVRVPFEYIIVDEDSKEIKRQGYKYTLYLKEYALTLTPINPKGNGVPAIAESETYSFDINIDIPNAVTPNTMFDGYYVRANATDVYKLDVHYNGIDRVNAYRIGKERDEITDGRTCISLLNPAVTYMSKAVDAITEADITFLAHVFQQKIQYVETCKLDTNNICPTSNENIKTCSKCGGTGMPVHKTSSDILTIPMPTDPEQQLMDLSKLVHYVEPSVEVISEQRTRLKELEEKAYSKVFNSDDIIKASITDSATSKLLQKQSKYNAYLPYAEKVAEIYRSTVYLIAAWRDEQQGLIVEYILPGDFKLESLAELLDTLKSANDSGLPAPLRETITNDIAAKMYTDQPTQLRKYLTRQFYNPFRSKTDVEIQALIANSLVMYSDKVLWGNFDRVFSQIEITVPMFYSYELEAQAKIVNAEVTKIADIIKAETQTAVSFGG